MRSLIVRFINCEGPGIIENSLRRKNIKITYHDTFKKGLKLVPESHQIFDLIIFMGGPQSVADPAQQDFFKPYYQLAEDSLSNPDHKLIGICLGSQLLAKTLGAEVNKGISGPEIGFSKVTVKDPSSPAFKGITGNEIEAFHLHEDIFSIPKTGKLLLSGSMYENQMFSYENRVFGIQCHLEPSLMMLETWSKVHKDFIGKTDINSKITNPEKQKSMEKAGQ
ncbi:MAG: type 1 glutamine amidotransferase, partial [Leptospira sp.]|nr:type 1 glutamine amidotransferase [Leptospira sp.]